MLELLFMVFLGTQSADFFAEGETRIKTEMPGIEWLELAPLPQKSKTDIAPRLLSDPLVAVFAKDVKTGKTLFSTHADRPQPIASITKLMTYAVIREHHDLDEVVTVSPIAAAVGGASVDLYAHERLSVETLLEAILIPSANDAATALAIWDAGSEKAFVEKMNQKAKAMGFDSARFYNASGLDIEGPVDDCDVTQPGCKIETLGNVMSATDIMTLTRILLRDDWFARTVAKQNFFGVSVDGEFSHEKVTTNKLFGSFIETKGVKTGYTPLAGQCFVNLAVDDDGNEVITVVLGSADRFTETKHVMDWIWKSYVWQ